MLPLAPAHQQRATLLIALLATATTTTASSAAAAAAVAPCQLNQHLPIIVGSAPGACWRFDLSPLPVGSWTLHDNSSYHTPYEVASPCGSASTASCVGQTTASPAYALIGQQGAHKSTCYALGAAAGADGTFSSCTRLALIPAAGDSLTDSTQPPAGLEITIPGGVGGRTLIYRLLCDPAAPNSAPPSAMDWHGGRTALVYPVVWHTKAGCPVPHQGKCPPSPPPPCGPPPPPPPAPPPTPCPDNTSQAICTASKPRCLWKDGHCGNAPPAITTAAQLAYQLRRGGLLCECNNAVTLFLPPSRSAPNTA
jgi:hypothetical protein